METRSKVCLVPKMSGIGGMVSFQSKIAAGFASRKVDVCFNLDETPYDAVLVIGGTRQIRRLWRVKRSGIRVVQRLDGMNWVHRVIDTGWRHWLRAEYGNFNLSLIRSSFADKIVYQSEFSSHWWERVKGITPCPSQVIYNAVDLKEFSPAFEENRPRNVVRLLLVEGSLLGGYEFGLQNAVKLAAAIAHSLDIDAQIVLVVVGKVPQLTLEQWENWVKERKLSGRLKINWAGVLEHSQIADIYRSASFYYSADVNAACPNSVIEAMACGIPVISFDTGALSELLDGKGGILVPYGGDPWKLEPPDIQSLADAAFQVIENVEEHQVAARERAEAAFDIDLMVDRYLDALYG
jgi:glycosyltransferase involved in cell wall biosynthesis